MRILALSRCFSFSYVFFKSQSFVGRVFSLNFHLLKKRCSYKISQDGLAAVFALNLEELKSEEKEVSTGNHRRPFAMSGDAAFFERVFCQDVKFSSFLLLKYPDMRLWDRNSLFIRGLQELPDTTVLAARIAVF